MPEVLKAQTPLKDFVMTWKKEAGIGGRDETTIIHFHEDTNTLYIITKFSGWFIGKGGSLVNKYKNRIREKLGIDIKIKFVEALYQNVKEF